MNEFSHPYIFFLAIFLATLTLGVVMGFKFNEWRVGCLQRRIDLLKLEIQTGRSSVR